MADQLPSSREAALQRGLSRYFDGLRCRNGHIALRRAKDGRCIACKSAAEQRRRVRRQTE